MVTWARATRVQRCGGCGAAIAIGDRVARLSFAGQRFIKTRCGPCAGGAPPELPAVPILEEAPDRAAGMLTRIGLLPLDWRRS